jgi:hypothetical protein
MPACKQHMLAYKYSHPAKKANNLKIIVWPWPTVKPSEKRSFLTLTQCFDSKTQFSGRMDGTISFALLFGIGIKFFFLIWNQILSTLMQCNGGY